MHGEIVVSSKFRFQIELNNIFTYLHTMRLYLLSATLSLALAGFGHGFVVPTARLTTRTCLSESSEPLSDTESLTPEEEEQVGNLVANEEWEGLSMELAEVVTTAVVEDLKKNSRYKVGECQRY